MRRLLQTRFAHSLRCCPFKSIVLEQVQSDVWLGFVIFKLELRNGVRSVLERDFE